jgi:hypothetical protein
MASVPMTRDEAIRAIAQYMHEPLIEYYEVGVRRATQLVDSLILIGVFVPKDQKAQ